MDIDEIATVGFIAENACDIAFPIATIVTAVTVTVITFFIALNDTIATAVGGGSVIFTDDHFDGAVPITATPIFVIPIVTLFVAFNTAIAAAICADLVAALIVIHIIIRAPAPIDSEQVHIFEFGQLHRSHVGVDSRFKKVTLFVQLKL